MIFAYKGNNKKYLSEMVFKKKCTINLLKRNKKEKENDY